MIKEEFIEFSKNLVFELRKAEADEEDEECNLEQFKGQLEKFNVPEFDVIKGFINFQMPQQATQDQKVIPEIAKKKQEKKTVAFRGLHEGFDEELMKSINKSNPPKSPEASQKTKLFIDYSVF